ncbi:MAG: hypothetical protein Wins2KO_09230 [Winogradskyella sp.]
MFTCDKKDESLDQELIDQLDTVVYDNVKIVQQNTELFSSTEDIINGTLVIEPADQFENVVVGEVLIGEDNGGYLVKVIDKNIEGTVVTFDVEQANLEDVFEHAEFSFSANLSDDAGRNGGNGSSRNQSMNGEGFNYDFSNTVIYQDGPIVFKVADGNASFNPEFTIDFEFEDGNLQFFEFKAENADLIIDCGLFFGLEAGAAFNTSTTIAEFDKTFTTFVGLVPVVVTISTELVAELSIQADGQFGFTGGFVSNNSTTFGATYNNGVWSHIGDTNSTITGKPVENPAVAQINQNLTITPKVDIKFYNIIGPYCTPVMTEDLELGVSFDNTNPDWNAKVDAGLDIIVGADAEILGTTLVDFNTSIYSTSTTVWQAPTTLEIVSGNDQEGSQGGLLDDPLKVKVTDNMGDPVSNVQVYFDVTPGDGELNESNVMTDDEGFAEVQWTLGTFTTEQTVNVEIKNSQGNSIGSVLQFTASAEEAEISITGDLNFGEVSIGSTEDRIFTIENESLTDVNVPSIDVPNGFTINWNNGLIPSESVQEITVTFSPTELQEYTGDIIINNNVDDINNLISVSGTGVVEDAISLTGDLDFGDVDINSTATRVLTIQNNTIIPIMVNSITLPNGFTANWTNGMIDGQSSQLVDIIFQPTNIQSYSGIVIINNDLDSENNTIAINGYGVEQNLAADITGFWISDISMNNCNAAGNSNDQECINHTTFQGLELEFSEDLGYSYCQNSSISCGIVYNEGVYLNSEVFIERSFNFDGINLYLEIRTYSTSGYFFDDRTFIFNGIYDELTETFSGNYSHETDGGLWNNQSDGLMTLSRPE